VENSVLSDAPNWQDAADRFPNAGLVFEGREISGMESADGPSSGRLRQFQQQIEVSKEQSCSRRAWAKV